MKRVFYFNEPQRARMKISSGVIVYLFISENKSMKAMDQEYTVIVGTWSYVWMSNAILMDYILENYFFVRDLVYQFLSEILHYKCLWNGLVQNYLGAKPSSLTRDIHSLQALNTCLILYGASISNKNNVLKLLLRIETAETVLMASVWSQHSRKKIGTNRRVVCE